MSAEDIDILERRTAYDGFFRIDVCRLRYRLYDGGWSEAVTRELFERGHAAAVLPYDARRDEVVLIEQFSIGAIEAPGRPWLLEIVAGIIEGEETPEEVVRREAVEEAGCSIEELVHVCDYFSSPGGTSERISLYCGKVDAGRAGGVHGLASEGEDIRVIVMAFDEAMTAIAGSSMNAASLLIAMQWLALNRESLRARWGEAG